MKVYVDTNVVVGSIVDSHIHYDRCKPLMDEIAAGKYEGFISGHGLTEIYSVLTRTPFVPLSTNRRVADPVRRYSSGPAIGFIEQQ